MGKFILTGWKCGDPFHSIHATKEEALGASWGLDDSNWQIFEGVKVAGGKILSRQELVVEAVAESTGLINAIKLYREKTRDEYGSPDGLGESKERVEEYIVSTYKPTRAQIVKAWRDAREDTKW